MSNANTKVIVGMSGGVDSSVAAHLLQQQGYAVEGLFMKNWDEDDGTEYCTAKDDLADAQAVADKLGIKLHTANFASEYWDNVFEYFLEEYKAGRTPNPDILCNREIKFKAFLDYAKVLGATYIATGHYADVQERNGQACLIRSKDENKDQTYFLHAVNGSELAQCLFPLANIEKPEVRKIAEQQALATARKKDSTGICFIGERRFKDFLAQYLPAQPGNIIDTEGNTLGKHNGLMYHTLGQRQGLGIGGIKNASEAPWYVVGKDIPNNRLVVGQGNDNPALFSSVLSTAPVFWVNQAPAQSFRCTAKVRYRQPDQACLVTVTGESVSVTFDEPQRAVTPGQSLVLYLGDICLGGAVIESTQATYPDTITWVA